MKIKETTPGIFSLTPETPEDAIALKEVLDVSFTRKNAHYPYKTLGGSSSSIVLANTLTTITTFQSGFKAGFSYAQSLVRQEKQKNKDLRLKITQLKNELRNS